MCLIQGLPPVFCASPSQGQGTDNLFFPLQQPTFSCVVKQEKKKKKAQSHLKIFTVLLLWLEGSRGQSDLLEPLLLPSTGARLPVLKDLGMSSSCSWVVYLHHIWRFSCFKAQLQQELQLKNVPFLWSLCSWYTLERAGRHLQEGFRTSRENLAFRVRQDHLPTVIASSYSTVEQFTSLPPQGMCVFLTASCQVQGHLFCCTVQRKCDQYHQYLENQLNWSVFTKS